MAKRLIDGNSFVLEELLDRDKAEYLDTFVDGVRATMKAIRTAPTVDAVEVPVLEIWLYEIAMNNTGTPLCDSCEEIIRRLPGLRRFAEEYGGQAPQREDV